MELELTVGRAGRLVMSDLLRLWLQDDDEVLLRLTELGLRAPPERLLTRQGRPPTDLADKLEP